jgi:acetoin utilization deacetylase AcuC-like enzyme
MTTALITHPACLKHEPPQGHPERPARLEEVLNALEAGEFRALVREFAPQASQEALERVHARDYVEAVLAMMPKSGFARLDADTIASPGTGEAILRAAGAVVRGVDMVLAGEVKNAFCAVRPPGHHATPHRAMGFCFFNNVAVGALHARDLHGLKRVAVVDFDVHHGNGTQDRFTPDSNLFYASTHQSPLYPGTGGSDETGISHNIVNVPLPPGAGGAEFRRALESVILPALTRFQPEFLMISAGFDAHRNDPLAQLRFEESDYSWATGALCAAAERLCKGRVVSTLEGGYDLEALAASAAAHVRALMAA